MVRTEAHSIAECRSNKSCWQCFLWIIQRNHDILSGKRHHWFGNIQGQKLDVFLGCFYYVIRAETNSWIIFQNQMEKELFNNWELWALENTNS